MGSIRQYKKASILTPLFVTGEVIMESIIPFIVAMLVNQIKRGAKVDELLYYGMILIVLAIISLIFGWQAGKFAATASSGFARNLRSDIFSKIQEFSFKNIDKFSSSSLVTRLTTDISNVQMAYMLIIRAAVRAPLMFIFSFIMAYVIGGRMSIIFLAVVPILGIGIFLIMRRVLPIFRSAFKRYDALNASIQENIKGIRVVKAYVREEKEIDKFSKTVGELRRDFTRADRLLVLTSPLMQFSLYSVMVFIFSFGSYLIISTKGLELDVGQFSSLITYSWQILMALNMLGMIISFITMSTESAERIVEVLNEESTLTNPENPVMEVKNGDIEFNDVYFSYSDDIEKSVLDDINVHIKSGETIGIIGSTGSSKTTFVNLISRLYDVTKGQIKVGGIDVRDYDLEVLRDKVAVVLQKNVVFSGTIAENLRWGNKNATQEEIERAAKIA